MKLPPSLTVNASSANGLGSCTLEQIGFTGLTNERQFFHFDSDVAESFTPRIRRAETPPPIAADADSDEVVAALETLPGLAGNVKLDGAAGGWVVTFVGGSGRDRRPDADRRPLISSRTSGSKSPAKAAASTSRPAATTPKRPSKRASRRVQTLLLPAEPEPRTQRRRDDLEGPGLAPGTRINIGLQLLHDHRHGRRSANRSNGAIPDGRALQRQREGSPGSRDRIAARASVRATSSSTPPASSTPTRTYRIAFVGALAGTDRRSRPPRHLTGSAPAPRSARADRPEDL